MNCVGGSYGNQRNRIIDQLGVDKIESIPADRLKEAQDLIAKTKKEKGME